MCCASLDRDAVGLSEIPVAVCNGRAVRVVAHMCWRVPFCLCLAACTVRASVVYIADMQIVLSNQCETEFLAAQLAERCRPGDCLALSGPYGAGKSTFVRAFLRALSGDGDLDVPSPSFPILLVYDTPQGVAYHYDLWRLEGPEALDELDWDMACESLMLIEWPERAGGLVPKGALWLTLETLERKTTEPETPEQEAARRATLTGWPDDRLSGLGVPACAR